MIEYSIAQDKSETDWKPKVRLAKNDIQWENDAIVW